jgi:hypothetical protein
MDSSDLQAFFLGMAVAAVNAVAGIYFDCAQHKYPAFG